MFVLKVFIIIFVTKSIKSLQVNFTCEHKIPSYVISSISKNNEEKWCNVVENLKIEHKNVEIIVTKIPDKNRIEGFVAENKEILYFPKGLEDTFPNLNHLVIKNSSLKTIARKNLKNFQYLQYIDLSDNEIEILEKNVFNLEMTILTIILKNNKIKFVHQSAFKSVGLSHLDFEGNICFDEKAINSKDVELLIKSLSSKCASKSSDDDELPVQEIFDELATIIPSVTQIPIKHEISTKPIEISSDSNSSSKGYITYGLIIIFFSSLIIIIVYTKNRKSSTNLDTELPKSKITKVESSAELFDLPKSDNCYQTEAVYEEINYESNFAIKEYEKHEIEDFYVETNQNEAVEESGSYTVVYKSTEDLS